MVPMMIYNILLRNAYNLVKGEDKQARWEALKGLSGTMATSFALAGLSGAIPEPVRLAITATNLLGLTDNYQEQEDKTRKMLANEFGPEVSGLISDGLSGFAGADMHHRFGIQSLMIFGEPRSNNTSDVHTWVDSLIEGVPGGLGTDAYDLMSGIRDGNYEKALEAGIPIKGITDIMKAVRLHSEGKPTASGMPGMTPISGYEAVLQALGWGTEKAARYGAARAVLGERAQEKRDFSSQIHRELLGGDREGALDRLNRWNAANPSQQMNVSDLLKAAKQALQPELFGQKLTPRNQAELEEAKRAYLQ
jgi:hypothetical protein